MTKDMGIAEVAAFASAFADKVCFQASQLLCSVLGRGGSVDLAEEDQAESSCANCMCTYPGHTGARAMSGEGTAKQPYDTAPYHLERDVGIRRFLLIPACLPKPIIFWVGMMGFTDRAVYACLDFN